MQSLPSAAQVSAHQDRYRCGTLVYTKGGLFALFGWLLWGDFSYTLMESVWVTVLPLTLKSQGAPNTVIALVIATIPQAMNFILNPIISTASDRHRGKRGRRIPFLLYSAPFISLFLTLLGFSPELGALLYPWIGAVSPKLSQTMVTVGLICVLIVIFRFFELFVGTVFWYLFNDVVPEAFMGRFLGMFRVIGALAGVLFNFFLLQYAESHTSMIFLGGAILYGTAFLLLGFKVKEGKYPPPDKMSEKKGFSLTVIKTFFRESFSHRIYRLVFVYSAMAGISTGLGAFGIFMALSLGLTLADVGKIAAFAGVIGMLLLYPMGSLVDRFHPLRIMLVAQITYCFVILMQFVFLFYDFQPRTAFFVYGFLAAISAAVFSMNTAAGLPMLMHLFPRERFGQFCAANAMCAAMGSIIAGMLGGIYLDTLKGFFPDRGDYYYRFVPVWSFIFMALATAATILMYRQWNKLGGDQGYQPPAVR